MNTEQLRKKRLRAEAEHRAAGNIVLALTDRLAAARADCEAKWQAVVAASERLIAALEAEKGAGK